MKNCHDELAQMDDLVERLKKEKHDLSKEKETMKILINSLQKKEKGLVEQERNRPEENMKSIE